MPNQAITQIDQALQERIIAAANELYESNDRQAFPTVDSVRRAAKADMNTTAIVVREWRKNQTDLGKTDKPDLPNKVEKAIISAGGQIWEIAQELAKTELEQQKNAWQFEKAELQDLNQELIQSIDDQALEVSDLKKAHEAQITRLKAEIEQLDKDLAQEKETAADQNQVFNDRILELKQETEAQQAENKQTEQRLQDALKAASDAKIALAGAESKALAAEKQVQDLLSLLTQQKQSQPEEKPKTTVKAVAKKEK